MQLSCIQNPGLNLHLTQIVSNSVELQQRSKPHPEETNSTWKGRIGRRELCTACDLALQVTWGQDTSFGECRAVGGRKQALQRLQLALVREIAFCAWLAGLLCLINRLCSEAVSGNGLSHGTRTLWGCWGSTSIASEAFTAAQPPLPCLASIAGYLQQPRLDITGVSCFIPFLGCWRCNKRKALHQMQNSYELLIWK